MMRLQLGTPCQAAVMPHCCYISAAVTQLVCGHQLHEHALSWQLALLGGPSNAGHWLLCTLRLHCTTYSCTAALQLPHPETA